MVRGQSDYGIYQPLAQVAGLADVGEAAVRLGSINIFDRKGWTVWFDDFEGAKISWDASNGFGGLAPVLNSTYVFSGSQSLRLKTEAGGSSFSRVVRSFSLLASSRIGSELLLQSNMSDTSYLSVVFSIADGSRQYNASLRFYEDDELIKIYTGGDWVTVATDVYMYTDQFFFLPLKLVIDIDNNNYDRLRVGEQEIDLSSYPLEDAGVVSKKLISLTIGQHGQAVGDSVSYIDNFILTQNEP